MFNKEEYRIKYSYLGKNYVTHGEAFNTTHAEELFDRNFDSRCVIIRTMTSKEHIKNIVNEMFKGIRSSLDKVLKE